MGQPLVSIIIPTYNRAHLIGETLDSVLAQTYSNWECIVVDDGSTDGTEALLQKYVEQDNRFQYHHRPKDRPKGANACRNYGFEVSKGEYVNWFDSDDLMTKDFIVQKIEGFTHSVDIVISKSVITINNNQIRQEARTKMSNSLLEDFITLKVSWYLPDPIYRREFIESKQLFDERLLKGQDRDFHIRILIYTPTIKFIDKYLTYYRQISDSISNDFSVSTILSSFYIENERIKVLLSFGINKDTRLYLLKEQLKKYRYLWQINGIAKSNYQLFYQLGFLSFNVLKWFLKFSFSIISYKLVGKGYILLRG
ncbi:MAG: hypothetical protein CL526_00900 [Aequorivita sp.]|nr:hypothetical protein [Aequorivita sp.]|tara:strand:+ start:10482 stop:11411 length:930 start_codon:yes stop_codon:yes gene_type:complete